MKRRINAGYTIIKSIKIDNTIKTEFVLGENLNAPSPYVTWWCGKGTFYYYGSYCSDKMTAMLDLYKRTRNEIELQIMLLEHKIKESKTEVK